MQLFEQESKRFFEQLGEYKIMVLSTALQDKVTSRMMSVVVINEAFYFQTDKTMRKYEQIIHNPRVALCVDNIQIEGSCTEAGRPIEDKAFCKLFQEYFKGSYEAYSDMENERLFKVKPARIQQWIYEDGKPFVEVLDFEHKTYLKEEYIGR